MAVPAAKRSENSIPGRRAGRIRSFPAAGDALPSKAGGDDRPGANIAFVMDFAPVPFYDLPQYAAKGFL